MIQETTFTGLKRCYHLKQEELNYPLEADLFMVTDWIPEAAGYRILGRVGYDIEREYDEFDLIWYPSTKHLLVFSPQRLLHSPDEYEQIKDIIEYADSERDQKDAIPYCRFPRTKDGISLLDIMKTLFADTFPTKVIVLIRR